MNSILLLLIIVCSGTGSNVNEIREIEYNGQPYATTYNVEKFNGMYSGSKTGYLELRPDGTGTYAYDIFGIAPADCKRGPITLEYGFLLDDNNELIRLEREYGYSYPLLLKSTGETSFQGCRTAVMLDFVLEKKDSTIGISSSDDWIKQ